MKLSFDSESLIPYISEAFSVLTDKAIVCINNIYYEKANGVVKIYFQRREIIGVNKSLLRRLQPAYGQSIIKSLLTIEQVEEVKIEVDNRLVEDCNSRFQVLFGLKIDGNLLHLGSVEEFQGKVLCQITIKVKRIKIDFNDVEEI